MQVSKLILKDKQDSPNYLEKQILKWHSSKILLLLFNN